MIWQAFTMMIIFILTGSFDDGDTFAKYGQGYACIEDWRRHNVDLLIQETYQLVHQKPGVVFGVSPAGVWANRLPMLPVLTPAPV